MCGLGKAEFSSAGVNPEVVSSNTRLGTSKRLVGGMFDVEFAGDNSFLGFVVSSSPLVDGGLGAKTWHGASGTVLGMAAVVDGVRQRNASQTHNRLE